MILHDSRLNTETQRQHTVSAIGESRNRYQRYGQCLGAFCNLRSQDTALLRLYILGPKNSCKILAKEDQHKLQCLILIVKHSKIEKRNYVIKIKCYPEVSKERGENEEDGLLAKCCD